MEGAIYHQEYCGLLIWYFDWRSETGSVIGWGKALTSAWSGQRTKGLMKKGELLCKTKQ